MAKIDLIIEALEHLVLLLSTLVILLLWSWPVTEVDQWRLYRDAFQSCSTGNQYYLMKDIKGD